MITIAVAKGRIWNEALPLLAELGLAPDNDANTNTGEESRRLILPTANPGVRLILTRAQDTPVFVACGAAQMGIAGGDILEEKQTADICQPLDLQIAKCRMVLAAPRGRENPAAGRPLAVATKYVNTARKWFAKKGAAANFIKLGGNMEIAPLAGLADAIVDLADTGKTLRDNGLEEKEKIADISAKLILNRVAARRQRKTLAQLQQRIAEAIAQRNRA